MWTVPLRSVFAHAVAPAAVALAMAALTACTDPFYCTPGAATWHITVLDAGAAPVTDLRWTAVIERTHDTIPAATLAAHSDPASSTYAIFTHDVQDRIDPAGDVVVVEGASGLDWFTAQFEFGVPDPDCHADLLSGPDTVTLAPAPFVLAETRAWGGGDIAVTSPVLRLYPDDSLRFVVGADTVWSAPLVGDSAVLEAPVSTGTYGVAILRGAEAESLGTVEVRGYGGSVPGPR